MYKYFSPIILFISGQLLFFLPVLFSAGIERMYETSETYDRSTFLYVHLHAIIVFSISAVIGSRFANSRTTKFRNLIFKDEPALIAIILVSIIIQIFFFKGIPVFNVIVGSSTIADVNNRNDSAGGILGLTLLLNLISVMLAALLLDSKNKKNKVLLILLFLNCIIQAKRQLLFFLLFTVVIYNSHWLRKRNIFILVVICIFAFTFIGQIRGGGNVLQPILVYIAIPLINEFSLISQSSNLLFGNISVLSVFELSLPSIMGGKPTLIALPYPSGGAGMVGTIWFKGGIIGATIFYLVIGFYNGWLFKEGYQKKLQRLIYAFGAWGLFASSTYILYLNVMFYLLPLILIILLFSLSKRKDLERI